MRTQDERSGLDPQTELVAGMSRRVFGGCDARFGGLKCGLLSESVEPIEESSELVLSGRVRLLEADPELGARLEGEELDRARKHAMLPALHLEEGDWDIEQLRDAQGVRGEVYGFVLTEGTITIDAIFADRRATRALGANELILLDWLG